MFRMDFAQISDVACQDVDVVFRENEIAMSFTCEEEKYSIVAKYDAVSEAYLFNMQQGVDGPYIKGAIYKCGKILQGSWMEAGSLYLFRVGGEK